MAGWRGNIFGLFDSVKNNVKTMTELNGKCALVIGASSGVGRATVKALISSGAKVTAVARGAEKLRTLKSELGEPIATASGDATDPAFVERLLRELRPDVVALAAGVTPRMARVDEFEWESFSEAWNNDLKASFILIKLALVLPLKPGSTVVLISSGAVH